MEAADKSPPLFVRLFRSGGCLYSRLFINSPSPSARFPAEMLRVVGHQGERPLVPPETDGPDHRPAAIPVRCRSGSSIEKEIAHSQWLSGGKSDPWASSKRRITSSEATGTLAKALRRSPQVFARCDH